MKISRIKFVLLFVGSAFVFVIGSRLLLNQEPEMIAGASTQAPWQSTISTILSPIKAVLMGPLIPFFAFLRQEPDTPPPFFLISFIIYWSLLALLIYSLFIKRKLQTNH